MSTLPDPLQTLREIHTQRQHRFSSAEEMLAPARELADLVVRASEDRSRDGLVALIERLKRPPFDLIAAVATPFAGVGARLFSLRFAEETAVQMVIRQHFHCLPQDLTYACRDHRVIAAVEKI